VATQFAQLAIDLGAIREGQGRVVGTKPVERADRVVELLSALRCERVDELVDRLVTGGVAVIDGLHHGGVYARPDL
jgi:hypothetical protein